MEYQLNSEFIDSCILKSGKKRSEIALMSGIEKRRLSHLLGCPEYHMRITEAEALAKTLGVTVDKLGQGFMKNDGSYTFSKDRYTVRYDDLYKVLKSVGMMATELSVTLGHDVKYMSTCKGRKAMMDAPKLWKIAGILKVHPSKFSDVKSDFKKESEIVETSEKFNRPFALNCSEMLSPVEIVKALPNVVDFKHWHKLEEVPNPHIEHRIDGRVVFRYENGHAVLFADKYIKPSELIPMMERIKRWGKFVEE